MTTDLSADLTRWLLDTDVALRWQVERDLLGLPEKEWQATRARVGAEGFGARLLALQDDDGQWAGGAYFPGQFDPEAEPDGQPWTATTWSLNALREWGVEPALLNDTAGKLEAARWEYEDLPFWDGEVDACINSWTLSNAVWLGVDADRTARLADWFVEHRTAEGGWNCEWVEGSTRSSFPSTLNSLWGLLDYEAATGDTRAREARRAGEEYLLRRQLHRRLSTGEPFTPTAHYFAYPFRWYYNVLVAADYFRAASLHDGIAPDARLGEAVELVRADREADGTWLQARRHPGRVWFEVDVPGGEPSPWVTFHALRVLRWWDEAR